MEAVLRPLFIYLFLLLAFSVAGKRSMSQMDSFDVVTLLIISESTQHAMIRDNNSIVYSAIVIMTLIGLTVFMEALKARKPAFDHLLQGGPIILVDHGTLFQERMKASLVDEQDILVSARTQGLERLDQIKFAILETSGDISIIPKK